MLRFLTAGESHGKCLVGIIEGVPAGFNINEVEINAELKKRKIAFGRSDRMQIETDQVEILSGLNHGVSMGTPIAVMIKNQDDRLSEDNDCLMEALSSPRPGHADLAGAMKYHHKDMRNILERASARETAARVAVGAICKSILKEFNVTTYSHVLSIGEVSCPMININKENFDFFTKIIDESPIRCAIQDTESDMLDMINRAREAGESLGGCFEIGAFGMIPGLGTYSSWDKRLDASIAQAIISIPGIKGIEIGDAVINSVSPGSAVHDQIYYDEGRGLYRQTNQAGGIEGGVSNGEKIWARAYMKPIPTLKKALNSVNTNSWVPEKAHYERADVCAVPSASVIGEAMLAFVLAQEMLAKFGGDNMSELKSSFDDYLSYLKKEWRWERI